MAKVKGRDLILEVVAAIEKAEHTAAQQAELLSEVRGLSERTTSTLGQLNERIATLEAEFSELTVQMVKGARLAQEHSRQLGQVGRLVRDLATGSQSRFDTIESRLDVLERKVG